MKSINKTVKNTSVVDGRIRSNYLISTNIPGQSHVGNQNNYGQSVYDLQVLSKRPQTSKLLEPGRVNNNSRSAATP